MKIQQMIRLGSLIAIGGLAVAAGTAGGCGGSTASSPSGGTGGGGGGGGVGGSVDAGNNAKKDAGGTGGAEADGGELSGDYGIQACPGVAPMKPAGLDLLPTCNDICGNAHCVPSSIPGTNSPIIPSCDNGGKCIPDDIAAVNGKFVLKTCVSSLAMKPGACVPECFLGMFMGKLPQDGCPGGTSCAPCVNPANGMPTGACSDYCGGGDDAGTDGTASDASSTTDGATTDATTTDSSTTETDSATTETDSATTETDSAASDSAVE